MITDVLMYSISNIILYRYLILHNILLQIRKSLEDFDFYKTVPI